MLALPRVRLRDLRPARARDQGRALDAAREQARHRRGVGRRRGGARARARSPRARVHDERRRRRLLRPEDRPAHARLARPLLAARHRPARLPAAAALRPPLPGRRQRRAHAGDDPSRADRLVRALHRHPARALRAARSRSGSPRCRCGSSRSGEDHREAAARPRGPARAAIASRSTTRDETVGKRIRNAELHKIPFVVVYGDKESDDSLAIREHGGGQSTRSLAGLHALHACYAVRLTSRGETFSHLLTSVMTRVTGVQPIRLRTVPAAACQRFFQFQKEDNTSSVTLEDGHLRPRRGSWEPPRRPEPQARINDAIRVPRVRLIGEEGRAAGDQADGRGARPTPTARGSISSRSRRRPTRPSPR